MYSLKDYHRENIAVLVGDVEEYLWFAGMCNERGYRVASPPLFPVVLSGWGTYNLEQGYYMMEFNTPEVPLCELQEYNEEFGVKYTFSEDEFLSVIGG